MKYQKIFEDTVKECNQNGTYIGTGNPNSKILIVGKETAIDKENKANRDPIYVQFQTECLQDFHENSKKWDYNIKNNIVVESIPNCIGGIDSPLSINPLYPFKSLYSRELKEGQTWRKYQKLHDLIFLNDM